jgi:formylglycine-generating enzyme required for sulfatase activity
MHGNVWEWCLDWLGEAPGGSIPPPADVADAESVRARRGGCWLQAPYYCRSDVRLGMKAGSRLFSVGFRVALAPPESHAHCEWSVAAPVVAADQAGPVTGQVWSVPGLSLDLVPIQAGAFVMGSDSGASDEAPAHRVRISRPFWMGHSEVTQRQYEELMGRNGSCFRAPDNPVDSVTWLDAADFCRRLTAREAGRGRLPDGYAYRLPTEAEWEYACRAGTTGDFGGDPAAMGWFADNSGGRPHEAISLSANAWGLYHMHGNVREWCLDWKGEYPAAGEETVDACGPASGWCRVARGGSWDQPGPECRSAARDCFWPSYANAGMGFRVVLGPVLPAADMGGGVAASDRPSEGVHGAVWVVPELDLSLVAIFPTAATPAAGGTQAAAMTSYPTRPFWIGRCEVTQREFRQLQQQDPSQFQGDRLPVENVTWLEATEFCRRLTERERNRGRLPTDFVYRLPTEGEWEYCARAGLAGASSGAVGDTAWYSENSGGKSHEVGTRAANAWGLNDMLGNVWEWCRGWAPPRLPYGRQIGSDTDLGPLRPYRGGSWYNPASFCRPMQRVEVSPLFRHQTVGFRVVLAYERAR